MIGESSDLDQLIIHKISDATEWPFRVHKLSQMLQHCGLSSSITSIKHPLSPHRVTELVQQVSERLAAPAPDYADSILPQSPSLLSTELRDLILLSVADIREIRRRREYGCFQHTRTFSLPLISRIGQKCHEHASVFADASFILPRSTSAQLGQLDGHFELLVAFVANDPKMVVPPGIENEPSNRPDSLEEDSPVGTGQPVERQEISESSENKSASHGNAANENSEDSDDSEGGESDDDESDAESDNSSEIDDESVESDESGKIDATNGERSLDMPFCAHLLPGHGRRLHCVLPVIAVANSDAISPLLSSILYQRYVWGIDLPAVGITISESGDIARVILAWLDSAAEVNEGLPIVHVAYADEQATCPSLGVFDLSDPIHALMFSQFILGLRSHFQDVEDGTMEPHVQPLSWRSDHIIHDLTYNDGLQGPVEPCEASIVLWASEVFNETRDHIFPPELPSLLNSSQVFPILLAPKGLPESDTSKRGSNANDDNTSEANKKGKSGEPSKKSRPNEKNVVAKSAPQLIPSATISVSAEAKLATEPAKTKSHLSSSTLAARSEQDVEGDISVSSFLFERNVISVTCLSLSSTTKVSESVNSMVELYDSLSGYCWPESWTAAEMLSKLHPQFQLTCEHLFQENRISLEKLERSVINLDDKLALLMSKKLSEVFLASYGAYSLRAVADHRSVGEAESRHDWDAMLYRFSVVDDAYISNNILLERIINYPRNPSLDEFENPSQGPDSTTTIAKKFNMTKWTNKKLLDEALYDAHNAIKPLDPLVLHQITAFLTEALRTLNTDNAKLEAQVRRHGPKEPDCGVVDAIMVVPIRGSPEKGRKISHTLINKFALVHCTDTYGSKDKSHLEMPASVTAISALPSTPGISQAAKAPKSDAPSAHQSSPQTLNPRSDSGLRPRDEVATLEGLEPATAKWYKELVRSPLSISISESLTSTGMPKPNVDPTSHLELDFRFPVLMVEHKRRYQTEKQALNQVRFYCTAAVSFLATLDITKQPVFGLVTCGSKGTVLMSWKFEEQIYIMERNMRHFDISEPLAAFQFATFLLRLAKWSHTLHEKYTAEDSNLADKLYKYAQETTDPRNIWTKEAQNPPAKKKQSRGTKADKK